MAPPHGRLSLGKVLVICLFLFLHASALSESSTRDDGEQLERRKQQLLLGRRRMLLADFEEEEGEAVVVEKQKPKKTSSTRTTTTTPSNKNQTKLSKPNLSTTKNQTKLIKSNSATNSSSPSLSSSTKNNQTKPLKTTSNSTKTISKSELKKLNSTTSQLIKKLNSTSKPSKPTSNSTKLDSLSTKVKTKPSDPPKNKTAKSPPTSSTKQNRNNKDTKPTKKPTPPSWVEDDDGDDQDLVSEFRDLPIKFQQTILPDLERISTTSKAYINKYNKEITKKYFNPIVGNKYAPTIANLVSFVFILLPLLLVSLVFNRFKAYFSLQKLLIFVQVYLSIYFTILCLSSLLTGLEPLKFFYATSRPTYICVQVFQTLGYVLYLLLLLMYLILVFSTDCGLATRMLGLAQTFVGFAVGLHYYVSVFHRVVLRQPPKTNWKVHGIYATCFLVICFFAGAERRKKAYLEDGGEEGKKN